jgi:hypothetical protein
MAYVREVAKVTVSVAATFVMVGIVAAATVVSLPLQAIAKALDKVVVGP